MTHVHNNLHILEQLSESETGELTYKGVQVRTVIPSGGIVGPKGETGQMGPPAIVSFDGEFPNDGIFDGLLCYRKDRFMIYYYTGYPELGESGWLPLSVQIAGSTFPTTGNFVGRLFWHTQTRQMYIYSGYPYLGELGWILFGASTGVELEDIQHCYLIGGNFFSNNSTNYYAKINLTTDTMSALNFTLTNAGLSNVVAMNGYDFSYHIRGFFYSSNVLNYTNLVRINNSSDAVTTGSSYSFVYDSFDTYAGGNNSNHSFILHQRPTGPSANINRVHATYRFTYLNEAFLNLSKSYGGEGGNSKTCCTATNIYLFCGIYRNPNNYTITRYDSIIKYNMDTNNFTLLSVTLPATQFITDVSSQGVTVKKTTGGYVIAGDLNTTRFFDFATETFTPKTITFPISYNPCRQSGQNLVKGVICQRNVSGTTAYINFSLTTETATLSSMMHTVPVNNDGRAIAQRSVF